MNVRISILLATALSLVACKLAAQSNLPSLATEHADIRINFTDVGTNNLRLVIRDEDHAVEYETNQIVLAVLENSQLTLPPGTPFGEGGSPIWVLPQSRLPGQSVLFLGLAAGGAGEFEGALTVHLKKLEGPGQFYVWQADEFGGLNVKINSADGVTAADKVEVLTAGHDHYNWGFSTSGVYCVTLEVSGLRVGETQPIFSPDATIVFHVQPLGVVTPFALWQKAHWLQGVAVSTNGPAADPDHDGLVNAIEYASNLDPNLFSTDGRPRFSLIDAGSETYGAFTFTRLKMATDLIYLPVVRTEANRGEWQILTNQASQLAGDYTDTITLRDSQSVNLSTSRYYKFRVTLDSP